MAGGRDDCQMDKEQRLEGEIALPCLGGRGCQHEIELAGAQVRQQVGVSALEDPYRDLRSRIGGKAESFREDQQRRQGSGADADPRLDVRVGLSHSNDSAKRAFDVFCLDNDLASEWRQRDAGHATPQDLLSKCGLQSSDAASQRGLSGIHRQGRAPDAAPLRDVYDPEEVAEVDPVQLGDARLCRHLPSSDELRPGLGDFVVFGRTCSRYADGADTDAVDDQGNAAAKRHYVGDLHDHVPLLGGFLPR